MNWISNERMLKGMWDRTDEAWMGVTHALGGLFCAGLGGDIEESVNTFGNIYPSLRDATSSTLHPMTRSDMID